MDRAADTIGIVGSPSTTGKVTVDILEDATSSSLHGALVYLSHPMDERCLIALGTVTEIKTANRWHEDPNMRGVLKRHGSLPHLSGVGDVRTADVLVQAAYAATTPDPSIGDAPIEAGAALTMSPTTGASVGRVSDAFLTQLLRRHADEIVYLGHIYRSDVRLPLTLKHFGSVTSGGAGEAYHSGVFGMTGSGKSGFAAYLLAAQARHPEMAILVIDPQGQFTTEQGLPFSLQEWSERQGRSVLTLSISRDIRLGQDAALLGDLLEPTRLLRDVLTIKGEENRASAVAEFTRILRTITGWDTMSGDDVLTSVLQTLNVDQAALTRIYSSQQSRARLQGAINALLTSQSDFTLASDIFKPLHSLFAPTNLSGGARRSLWSIFDQLLSDSSSARPLCILDFTTSGMADDVLDTTEVKARILRQVCSTLSHKAEQAYGNSRNLNALVVFDEAHRFASESPEGDEAARLAAYLVDAVRTTRKYGLGWMFVTQEIGSLKRAIYNQLRVRAFGYGLTAGSELQRLRETIGSEDALGLYRSFVDPQAISPREYPFMITGPVSPLSFTGAPVFLSVFTSVEDFEQSNGW